VSLREESRCLVTTFAWFDCVRLSRRHVLLVHVGHRRVLTEAHCHPVMRHQAERSYALIDYRIQPREPTRRRLEAMPSAMIRPISSVTPPKRQRTPMTEKKPTAT